MGDEFLAGIQSLQFLDKAAANRALKTFFQDNAPFAIDTVEIRPLATSLNSINGALTTTDGQKLFFKTHVEPQSIIDEYYNSSILLEVGYPIVQPIFSSTALGKQFLIYNYFEDKPLFDLAREIELNSGLPLNVIKTAQEASDRELYTIYKNTLTIISSEEHAKAPVHQLFYHRLVGGRLDTFYAEAMIHLPGISLPFNVLSQMQWRINGVRLQNTLQEVITLAKQRLNPIVSTPSVIGHGDAHNGNIFYNNQNNQLIYFDPAFAGRHSPFLDLAKPLFHNVFATWMYFPQEVAQNLTMSLEIKNDELWVTHDFCLTPVRKAFLCSKIDHLLKPLLIELKRNNMLSDWRNCLKSALFCCPFLTMNLADTNRFPPSITLLGLVHAMELGSIASEEHNLLNIELDKLEKELNDG